MPTHEVTQRFVATKKYDGSQAVHVEGDDAHDVQWPTVHRLSVVGASARSISSRRKSVAVI